MILKDKSTGVKLYPVCNFEDNQHRIDYVVERLRQEVYSENYTPELEAKLREYEDLYAKFNAGVYRDGLVYMPYTDGQKVKAILAGYLVTHKY